MMSYGALILRSLHTAGTIVVHTARSLVFFDAVFMQSSLHVCIFPHTRRVLGSHVYQVSLNIMMHPSHYDIQVTQ